MWQSYVIGMVGVVIVVTAWVAVQRGWKAVFPGVDDDLDALSGRLGCHGCKSPGSCTKSRCATSPEDEEKTSW